MRTTPAVPVTGRLSSGPSAQVHDEVLYPQFVFDTTHLLPHYLAVERVLLLEYERMGLVGSGQRKAVTALLDEISADTLTADPAGNMSDVSLAVEQWVTRRLSEPVPAWHVDRSRNDSQATAHALAAGRWLTETAQLLADFGEAAWRLAGETTDLPMPGYTHLQAAQVVTPGFHLAALSGQVLHTLRRWLATYDLNDRCPLGAGAMAGQQLPWDRARMAALLGFAAPVPHALTAVASRSLALEAAAEFAVFGTELSRFVTDLMTWGSGGYGFIELPDELAGISAAMPQKKNYPILERLRGKTAHLATYGVDALLAQRSTPYTNMVEVSKEATAHLYTAVATTGTVLRLATTVLANLRFRGERMLAACRREYLGGFMLANTLTLTDGVPWRQAQVLVGRYITEAIARELAPTPGDPQLLRELAARDGFEVSDPAGALAEAFDVEAGLRSRRSAGSVHPDAVAALLAGQAEEYRDLRDAWARRRRCRDSAQAALRPAAPGGAG